MIAIPCAIAVGMSLLPSIAIGAPDGGTVSGVIKLPSPSDRGEPPKRNSGFTERIANPLKPPKAFDPLPHIIVVLEGGVAADEDTKPSGRPAVYRLIGESFESPVMPVLAGSTVEIENEGKNSPRIYSPEDDKILDGESIGPRKKRAIKSFGPAYKVAELRDHDSAHLSGRLIAMPHTYFSRVKDDGKFEIEGVPAGAWKVKLWYSTGWLELPESSVVVVAKRSVDASITLPAKLTTAGHPLAKGK